MRRIYSTASYTLLEVMISSGIAVMVITMAMTLFITIYRNSTDATKQIRVQRKADMLVERLSRGPYGGYGGIRGAYLNTTLPGNALPNPTGGSTDPTTSNTFNTLTYYSQTNFADFVSLSDPVSSLSGFQTAYSSNVVLYRIGYNSTNRYIFYQTNNGSQIPMVELEDLDLAYLRFSGGIFQNNISTYYNANYNYTGTNVVYTNYASRLVLMEFGVPYWTSDGRRRITNHFSAKIYLRNNF